MKRWKAIPNYEGLYEVSNYGDIYSLRYNRELKPSTTTTGYKKIELYKDGKRKAYKIHRLVLYAFVGVKDDLVNHKDGNPINNHISNLEYCNQSYNMKHAYKTGLMKSYRLYEKEILDDYKNGMSVHKIVDKYKTSFKSINHLLDKYGLEKRKQGSLQNKYNIDLEELKKMFDEGLRNKDIASHFNTNTALIATRRYQYKKGII